MEGWSRIGRNLRRRQHIDAYVVAAVAILLALLSLVGSSVAGEDLRWSVALAALGLLVYRVTLPGNVGNLDTALHSRVAYEGTTFGSRLKNAKVVWVFAPSGANLLTGATADDLRRTILARSDGIVRIVVLDPLATAAVALASRQLDDSVDYRVHTFPDDLVSTVARLQSITSWNTPGQFEYRYAAYNPGFSLVAIDPQGRNGLVIVEFHGFHNESTGSRMHLELRRRTSEHWYEYWTGQFEHLWASSRPPDEPAP